MLDLMHGNSIIILENNVPISGLREEGGFSWAIMGHSAFGGPHVMVTH